MLLSWNAQAATHIVTFTFYMYTPNSMAVAVGDTIQWQGDFVTHPLSSTTIPNGAQSWHNDTGTTFSYRVTVPGTYIYQCDAHSVCCSMTGSFSATAVGVDDRGTSVPGSWKLEQNYPNPFNPTTIIRFIVPSTQTVTLKVFDIVGNEVATLADGKKPAGGYAVEFDGRHLASGIYLYRLETREFTQTKKLVLMK